MKVDRAWLKEHVDTKLEIEAEDTDWRHEFEGARETLQWIESELAAGNQWAWCMVTVKVRFRDFFARDHLGACSYQNEAEFKNGGYYDDMVDTCLDEIADAIENFVDEHALWEHEKRSCIVCLGE